MNAKSTQEKKAAAKAAALQDRKLRRARQLWRLCRAAEYVYACRGRNVIVADILKEAGMSQRDFYAEFDSADDLIYRLYTAGLRSTMREYASRDYPNAPWMICAAAPSRSALRDRFVAYFAAAENAEIRYALQGRDRYFAAPEDETLLLTWVAAMNTVREPV